MTAVMPPHEDDPIRCPACQSAQLHAGQRGWSFWTGMRGANSVLLTCLKCGHRFLPGARPEPPRPPPPPVKPITKYVSLIVLGILAILLALNL